VQSPVERTRVVCDVQDDRMGVISKIILAHHDASSAVIYDHCEELEHVDGDERYLCCSSCRAGYEA